ncbi:MAG: PspC domain-containing protein [Acidimicrobiales bacterium]
MDDDAVNKTSSRRLTRSSSDRHLGGVCGGVAAYFGVDASLVRVAAVAGAIFTGGTVVWLYLAAWWLLPESGEPARGEPRQHHRNGWPPWCAPPWMRHGGSWCGRHSHPDTSTMIGLALVTLAGVMVFHRLPFWGDDLVLAAGLIAVGLGILWFGRAGAGARSDDQWLAGEDPVPVRVVAQPVTYPATSAVTTPVAPADAVTDALTDPVTGAVADEPDRDPLLDEVPDWLDIDNDPLLAPLTSTPTPPPPVASPHDGRGHLVAPVFLGFLLLGTGLCSFLLIAGTEISAGRVIGVGLAVVGLSLVVLSWTGRGRWLVILGLALFGGMSLASVADIPLRGGFGERNITVDSAGDIDGEYALMAGEMNIDLSDLRGSPERPIEITASIGFGSLNVLVPKGWAVELDSQVTGGSIEALGQTSEGFQRELDQPFPAEGESDANDTDDRRLVLDLTVGFGEIVVSRTGE